MYDAEKGGGRKENGTGRSIHDWQARRRVWYVATLVENTNSRDGKDKEVGDRG
jgi:predicted acetyltransferase